MIINDPTRPGTLARPKIAFGRNHRYLYAPVNTRFANIAWFVWDTHQTEPDCDLPAIIRQFDDPSQLTDFITQVEHG